MKILVADLTDVRINLRPKRHIDFLVEDGHEIDVISLAPSGANPETKVRYFQIPGSRRTFSRPWWVRLISSKLLPPDHKWGEGSLAYRQAMFGESGIEEVEYDLCLVENISLLPGLLQLKKIRKFIVDVREYHPGQNEQSIIWRLWRSPEARRIYRHQLPEVDGVITVSKGIQNLLLSKWGVNSCVALSAPNQNAISPVTVPSRPMRLVHHGVAARKRGVDFVIDAIGGMSSATLTLFLVGRKMDIEYLVNRASQYENIEIREAVHPTKIVESMSEFDIGLAFFPLNNLNLVHSMPNKFFEYITAGTPPLVASGTDMAGFVEESSFGFTTEYSSEKSLRAFIESITPEDLISQRRFLTETQERISPRIQKAVLISLVDDVTRAD
jgi:hypothetical protein